MHSGFTLKTFFLLASLVAGAQSVTAQQASDTSWFRYGPALDQTWDVVRGAPRPGWIQVRRKVARHQSQRQRVLVIYPRPSTAYDTAITKVMQVFEAKDLNVDFTVMNFRMEGAEGREALRFAEAEKFDLIFSMGSESTAWLFENYRGGPIPVVSVCSKDPVQLGQMPDYQNGSGNNFAFTSLNVPVEVQMAYVREFSPNLRNLTVLVDSKNISAVQTQADPVISYAKQRGIQVIVGAVQDPSKAKEELVRIVRDAVAIMRKSDPDLSKSMFWVTGSTSVFKEIASINENADRVPVVSVVPEIVREGSDTAVLAIGVSFESNAQLAAIYGANILKGKVKPGELKVGIVSPPDIAVSFLKSREIGVRVPFSFFERASFLYDYDGKAVRTISTKMSDN